MTNDSHTFPILAIRRATKSDSKEIWQWRNDLQTKEMSINTEELSWDTHTSWYAKALENPALFLYIGLTSKNEKIGVCRFDLANDTAKVSINLNPQFRQKHLSTPLLVASIRQFYKTNNVTLTATIRHANLPSIKCFENAGFTFDSNDTDYCYYKKIFKTR